MQEGGPDLDVAISTRVRLARNVGSYAFPCLASDTDTGEMLDKVKSLFNEQGAFTDFKLWPMGDLSSIEKRSLVEKHLISPGLLNGSSNGALMVRNDEAISVLINEEDHFRIQAILPGLQLEEALVITNELDDIIEERFDYAFDHNIGYLTACPTNIGTGLRSSVMLHLPGMIMTRQFKRLLNTLSQVGLMVRGLYGEGTEIVGNMVQISNQVTLGHTEEEIINNLHAITCQIIEQEKSARQMLLDRNRMGMADKAWRAYGLLKYAQAISSQEAISLLSDLRLGFDLGLVKGIDYGLLNQMLVIVRPGSLQLIVGKELDHKQRSIERAIQIKEVLDRYPDRRIESEDNE